MAHRLRDALARLDERVLPSLADALASFHRPAWLDSLADRRDRYMTSSPWRDRFELRLYLGLVVGTFLVLWLPFVVVDAQASKSTAPGSGEVDKATDGVLLAVSIIVAGVGVAISRLWRRRHRD